MRVETETETNVTGQDAVEASAETIEQSATEIDESEDAVNALLESEDESSDDTHTEGAEGVKPPARWRRIKWSRVLAFGVLPLWLW